jgi:iron complex outermembrane receptor protein
LKIGSVAYILLSLGLAAGPIGALLEGQDAKTQSGSRNLGDLSLEELGNVQIYSASRHMQSEGEAPSSVTVITRDEIQKYGYRTLADILRSVRGLDITYDRSYTYAGVRGINLPDVYNSRILLLIDGHRINNNIYEQAMLGTEFPMDLDLIERVEIVRGPSSSLYGASAFFAVINVITRLPDDLNGTELSFVPASFGTYNGRASYGRQFKGIGVMLSGDFLNSQGQTLFYPEFNSPTTNNGIVYNADYDRYQHFLAKIIWRGFNLEGVYGGRIKGIPTASYGTVFGDPRSSTFDSQRHLDLGYQRTLGKGWDLAVRTSVARDLYDGFYVYAPPDPGNPDIVNYDFTRGTWWSGDVKLQRGWERNNLTFGTEFQENLQQDQGNYDILPRVSYVASQPPRSSIWALYGQDELTLTAKLSISAGLRFDHYTTFGGTANPRLGLIYHPFSRTAIKFLYGSAFRAPSAYELYYYAPGYTPSLDLKPETIKTYELAVEHALGSRFHVTGNLFRNQIDDLITEVTDSRGLLTFQNTSSARVSGVAAELDGRLADGLQGRASYSYSTSAGPIAGPKITYSPQQLAKLNVTVPIVRQKLFGSLEGQYNGPRPTLTESVASSYQVFNATLLAHLMNQHLDLAFSAYNLLDKKYYDPAPVGFPQNQIQQDGRSFRAKITVRF